MRDSLIIFSGNANRALAEKVAEQLDISLGKALISKFNDGEVRIEIKESVRNKGVFILQPTCAGPSQSINDNLVELYLMTRAMRRASAGSITSSA